MSRYRYDVQNLVDERWGIARDYSGTMWDTFQTLFEQLKNKLTDLSVPQLDFDPEISEIANLGEFNPALPDVSQYLTGYTEPDIPNQPAIETSYTSELLNQLIDKITADLAAGGTPFSEEVQTAIWEAARKRQDLEFEQKYDETQNFFASRGWIMPPGALAGRLSEIMKEKQRADEQINREIMIEQARIAKEHEQFLITAAADVEKTSIDLVVKRAQLEVDKYRSLLEAVQAKISAQTSWQDYLSKLFGMEMEGFRGSVELGTAKINAGIQKSTAQINRDQILANLNFKEAEKNLEVALETSKLQLGSLESAANLAAQITASALSAISAGVRMSYSGGYDYNYNYSHSSDYSNFYVNP